MKLTAIESKRHWTRAGVLAAARLAFRKDEPELWEKIEAEYSSMLQKKGGEKLVKLDDLLDSIGKKLHNSDRSTTCCINKTELMKVVEWKFAKGKARPALRKYLSSNTDAEVKQKTTEGFGFVEKEIINENDVKAALSAISELSGVGPATASAVLSLYRPENFVFMDDEVVECLYDRKRDYKLSTYLEINEKCAKLARELGEGWHPRRVGKVLWTASRLLATGRDLTASSETPKHSTGERKPKRRKK